MLKIKKRIFDYFPLYTNRNYYWTNYHGFLTLIRALLSGNIIEGAEIKSISNYFETQFNVPKVILTGSARCSLYLFLKALRKEVPKDYQVLVPFYICSSVITTVRKSGFDLKYIDIKPNCNLDTNTLTYESFKKVAAIIVPHIYGCPADILAVKEKINGSNEKIILIDDAAAAYNVKIKDKMLGSFGDAGLISFSQGKLLNSSGGGVLLLNNQKYYSSIIEEMNKLPNLNIIEKLTDLIYIVWKYGLDQYSGSISYFFERFGIRLKYDFKGVFTKMSNIDAAIALMLLSNIDLIHNKIKTIIEHYIFSFKQLGLEIDFPQFGNGTVNFPVSKLCCIIKYSAKKNYRTALIKYLRNNGIKIYLPYNPALNEPDYYYHYWYHNDWISNMFLLPIDYCKSIEWHDYIITHIDKFFRRY